MKKHSKNNTHRHHLSIRTENKFNDIMTDWRPTMTTTTTKIPMSIHVPTSQCRFDNDYDDNNNNNNKHESYAQQPQSSLLKSVENTMTPTTQQKSPLLLSSVTTNHEQQPQHPRYDFEQQQQQQQQQQQYLAHPPHPVLLQNALQQSASMGSLIRDALHQAQYIHTSIQQCKSYDTQDSILEHFRGDPADMRYSEKNDNRIKATHHLNNHGKNSSKTENQYRSNNTNNNKDSRPKRFPNKYNHHDTAAQPVIRKIQESGSSNCHHIRHSQYTPNNDYTKSTTMTTTTIPKSKIVGNATTPSKSTSHQQRRSNIIIANMNKTPRVTNCGRTIKDASRLLSEQSCLKESSITLLVSPLSSSLSSSSSSTATTKSSTLKSNHHHDGTIASVVDEKCITHDWKTKRNNTPNLTSMQTPPPSKLSAHSNIRKMNHKKKNYPPPIYTKPTNNATTPQSNSSTRATTLPITTTTTTTTTTIPSTYTPTTTTNGGGGDIRPPNRRRKKITPPQPHILQQREIDLKDFSIKFLPPGGSIVIHPSSSSSSSLYSRT